MFDNGILGLNIQIVYIARNEAMHQNISERIILSEKHGVLG